MKILDEILKHRSKAPKRKFIIELTDVDIEAFKNIFKDCDPFESTENMIECALETLILYEYDVYPDGRTQLELYPSRECKKSSRMEHKIFMGIVKEYLKEPDRSITDTLEGFKDWLNYRIKNKLPFDNWFWNHSERKRGN